MLRRLPGLVEDTRTETAMRQSWFGADVCFEDLIVPFAQTLIVQGVNRFAQAAPASEPCKAFLKAWNPVAGTTGMCAFSEKVLSPARRAASAPPNSKDGAASASSETRTSFCVPRDRQ